MTDQSALDAKYFIDEKIYNCPFCRRRHVMYSLQQVFKFDWTNSKTCLVILVKCLSCNKTSMHLSYRGFVILADNGHWRVKSGNPALDDELFYSVPTSFFVIDSRIPSVLRDLITEAESCLKMNLLTGASACTRKAIYELTVREKAEGANYDDRIKSLKVKFPQVEPGLFDILGHIKDMTSDKIHEQSWDKWDPDHLKLFNETLKSILHEIYVIPDERRKRSALISGMLPDVLKKKVTLTAEKPAQAPGGADADSATPGTGDGV